MFQSEVLRKGVNSARTCGKPVGIVIDQHGDERLVTIPGGVTRPALDQLGDELGVREALVFLRQQGIAVSAASLRAAERIR